MTFNQTDDPTEMLAWLSQRNHHIPLDDLAYMMESQTVDDYSLEMDLPNFNDMVFPDEQF